MRPRIGSIIIHLYLVDATRSIELIIEFPKPILNILNSPKKVSSLRIISWGQQMHTLLWITYDAQLIYVSVFFFFFWRYASCTPYNVFDTYCVIVAVHA